MEADRLIQEVAPILRYYGAQAYYVEKHGNVRKVYTNNGTFALKRIPANHGIDFVRYVQYLYQQGFNRIVPIYPTLDGRYAVMYNSFLYYLMPWMKNESEQDAKYKAMFRELARLHSISAKEVEINKEEKAELYERTIQEWEKDDEFIQGFIFLCEQKTYMSPFELLFCLYYNDVKSAHKFAKEQYESWFEQTKDDEKARAVLTHGKLEPDHFLIDERGYGYFSNLEKTRMASPLHDLLPFLSKKLRTYPQQNEEAVDWFYTYMKFFPLKEQEMKLFFSYFAYPVSFIKKAEEYFHKTNKNERKFVAQLQKEYWHLKNIEYIISRIMEIERKKKEEQQMAEMEQENEQL